MGHDGPLNALNKKKTFLFGAIWPKLCWCTVKPNKKINKKKTLKLQTDVKGNSLKD